MLTGLNAFMKGNEEGASAVEYALLVALIALVIAASVTSVGTKITSVFTSIAGKF